MLLLEASKGYWSLPVFDRAFYSCLRFPRWLVVGQSRVAVYITYHVVYRVHWVIRMLCQRDCNGMRSVEFSKILYMFRIEIADQIVIVTTNE